MKAAELFVDIDSFTLHIADAYQTSYIKIWGTTKPDLILEFCAQKIVFSSDQLRAYENIFNRR
jgi:ADP-heptose:LPS heptosyltransferase